jgi:two-component system chemotaxis response regulator CheB
MFPATTERKAKDWLMEKVVRVLIVDDSAYVRKSLKQILTRSPFLEVVGAARDGDDALELVERLKPDVITLDLTMPHKGGLAFVHEQMARRPLPIVIVSSTSQADASILQALEAGAIDVVQKPTALPNDRIFEIADDLIGKVKVAAAARVRWPGPTADSTLSSSGSRRGAPRPSARCCRNCPRIFRCRLRWCFTCR